MIKLNIDKKGIEPSRKKDFDSLTKQQKINQSGIAGDALIEPVPNFISQKTDVITKNSNNSWIVLTRDRPASRLSGYGGVGDTQAGAIDIVVGRMSANPREDMYVDPDFKTDAARIYISQKTDIDAYLGIKNQKANAVVGITSVEPDLSRGKSAVLLMSDQTRICGRENVKIFTRLSF